MAALCFTYLDSPVGPFLVAGDEEAIFFTSFTTGHQQRLPGKDWTEDARPLSYAVEQLSAYFKGEAVNFSVPLNPQGTNYQHRVWKALQDIPFGQTASYGEIAEKLGNKNASRAVGSANRANHLPILIPCHRVIGANGTLTGFGGGLDTKQILLALEGSAKPIQDDLFA